MRPVNLGIWLSLGLLVVPQLLAGCDDTDMHPQSAVQPTAEAELIYTADVERLVVASGTLKPVGEVEVSSEISGRIVEVLVDFNDVVRENQVIARIDPEFFEARLRQAEAALLDARATAMMREAALRQFSRSLDRISELNKNNLASEDEVDIAETAVQMGRAELAQAQAVIMNREAVLEEAKVALSRTAIRTPIDGVVISRDVMSGQTVAASFEAPRLFRIARTLSEMEIHAWVDEADIGRIRMHQRATFTVPAHGDRRFVARVVQVRVAPAIVEHVVTYVVVLQAGNEDESLLPGMTAIVEIDLQGAAGEVVEALGAVPSQ